MQQENN